VKSFDRVGFIDINWRHYDFSRHLEAVKSARPYMTIAKDVLVGDNLEEIIDQAYQLNEYANMVAIVPKDINIRHEMEDIIPAAFILGYSLPSRYGGTPIEPKCFKRPVHLLGGTPARQIALASAMDVYSFDCNRFTLDARFGDFFDGTRFRPHPVGGYRRCLEDSVIGINAAWAARPTAA
jgi:hypothetical protein